MFTTLPGATDPSTVLGQCRALWQVEKTFRVSQHDLKVRPVYHCTSKCIHAHITHPHTRYPVNTLLDNTGKCIVPERGHFIGALKQVIDELTREKLI